VRGPIACLDVDYFFAQAEELRNPAIRGKPVVVCVYSGRTTDAGVVATSNYVARRYGVKSGIPIKRAKELLRGVGAVFLAMDKSYYAMLSQGVFEIAGRYSDALEVASIDEAFLDLREVSSGSYERAGELMLELKNEIWDKMGLTCSVGVARNKLLAKMAADEAKPGGLLVVMPGTEDEFLMNKNPSDIPYIGGKTARRIEALGIKTIGELAMLPVDRLIDLFGFRLGRFIYLASRGEYFEQVTPRSSVKQLSRMLTLKEPSSDFDTVYMCLQRALKELHSRVIEGGYTFRGVSVIGINREMRTLSRGVTLPRPTDSHEVLEATVKRLIGELLQDLEGGLRRVGVKVYELSISKGQSRLTEFELPLGSEDSLDDDN